MEERRSCKSDAGSSSLSGGSTNERDNMFSLLKNVIDVAVAPVKIAATIAEAATKHGAIAE